MAVTDEQILEVLRDPQYTSEKQRAEALGITPNSGTNNRFRAIREQYGIPEPEPPKKPGRPKKVQAEPPSAEPTTTPFPFKPGEQILYAGRLHTVNSVSRSNMVIRENASLTAKTITADDYERNEDLFKTLEKKPQNTYERISFNKIDDALVGKNRVNTNGGGTEVKKILSVEPVKAADAMKALEDLFKPEPIGAKTKFEQVAEQLKEEVEPARKPATINQDFKAVVQDIDALQEASDDTLQNQPAFEDADYTYPAHGFDRVVEIAPARRGFLDRIDQLLDLTLQDCTDRDTAMMVADLAEKILDTGITAEIAGLLKGAGA